MGFLKKDSDFSSGEHFSVVSAECYFQGTLNVQGSLRVDGTLEGSVDNARHVIVGDGGKIVGDVTAQIVVCGGAIEGNVCADMLEEDRDFEGVDELRKVIWQDLHRGFVACMEHQYAYLVGRGGDIYPLTTKAVEYYRNENKQQ